jgi:hypothetical protein
MPIRREPVAWLPAEQAELEFGAPATWTGGCRPNFEMEVRLLTPGSAAPYPASATKFASSFSPTAWLFSGWNCVAKTLSRQTDEAKEPP